MMRGVGSSVKNANIFIDVDLTLVDPEGRLFDGAREALHQLRDEGCHLFLWSSVGAEYARTVAARYSLTELFEGFAAKPDIVIDDMPSTANAPFVYSVQGEVSWQQLVARIIEQHVD
jgi:beta-phosphoglucomutase-like phosphatase (HAD superfamily)